MALSKEQFAELRKKGLSVQQIVSFESGKKPEMAGGKFTVPETQVDRQNKISQYQQEAAQSTEEAKKANSPLGFLKNFGKSVVSTVANSEVALGKSIAKIIGAKDTTLTDAQNNSSDTEVALLKRINERKAQGADTTRLKQEYNRLKSSQGEVNDLVKEQFTLPTTGEVVGQIGGTALDVLTAGTYGKATKAMTTGQRFVQPSVVKNVATGAGLPELGKIAEQKASGLLTKRGLGNIATGSAIGYASDVTQGLQGARGEDRTGAKAFIPGVGTALGTAIPALSETNQSIKNQFDPNTKANNLAIKRQTELDKLDSYQTLKAATEKGRQRGIDVKKVLSETDVLHGAVDNTGTITTKGEGGAVEQYTRQFIDKNESIVSDALKKEGRSISADVVRAKLRRSLLDAGIEGKDLTRALSGVEGEMRGYSVRGGGDTIPVSTLHDAKVDKYNTINFFTDGSKSKYAKAVAKALKELVEENTTSIKVKEVNEELSKHFAVIDYLNKLDNKKVEGGKLGKYFAQTVGAIVGSHLGPLGSIVGAEAGGRLKGGLMSRVFNGKTGRVQPQAGVILDAQKTIDAAPLGLPAAGAITKKPSQAIPLGARSQSMIDAAEAANPNIKTYQKGYKTNSVLPVKGSASESPLPIIDKTNPYYPPDSELPVIPFGKRQSSKSDGSLKTSQATTIAPTKNVIPKTVSSSKPSATKLPTEGKEMFAGIGLGFEKDENGEITFNEDKALAGMIGVAGLSRSQAIQKLSKDLDLGTRKIMSDFVDAVRLNMTTKGGQFTFKNAETMTGEEAQKAFDEGLKLIQGEMGRGLKNEKIQQTLPKTLGIFYEDVIGASGKQQAGKVLPSRISTNLVAEAKKYKSAEEFVKAQGTPVYHGTSAKFDEFRSDLLGVNTNAGSAREGFFFATSKENALHYKPNTRVANPDVAKSLNKDLIANLAKKGLKTRVELPNSSLGYYQPTVVTPQRLTLDDFGSRLNGDIKEQWLNQGIADLETKKRLISRNSSDEKWFDDVIATYKETVKDSLISKKSSTSDRGELKVVYLNYKNPKILTDNRTIEGGRDLNFKDEIKKAKEEGYDAVIIKNTKDPLPTDVHVVFSAEQIKTKSQLTDIWEKANK